MKTHGCITFVVVCMTIIVLTACGGADKDTTAPTISAAGFETNPIDCQHYRVGDTIHFCYLMEDDHELGAYSIEVHNNFDHHTHGTSTTECEDGSHEDEEHEGEEHDHEHADVEGAWVFIEEYAIPAGLQSYTARQDIVIPTDIEAGDYHFAIRLSDQAGWQTIKAIAIEIGE